MVTLHTAVSALLVLSNKLLHTHLYHSGLNLASREVKCCVRVGGFQTYRGGGEEHTRDQPFKAGVYAVGKHYCRVEILRTLPTKRYAWACHSSLRCPVPRGLWPTMDNVIGQTVQTLAATL
ncbi:hypothetical protein HOY80DRAFT_946767, partial [Tuber brumale]